MSRPMLRAGKRAWLARARSPGVTWLLAVGVAGCGSGPAPTVPSVGNGFEKLFCSTPLRDAPPSVQLFIKRAGGDPALCAATSKMWTRVLHAVGRLTPAQLATMGAAKGGAAGSNTALARAITDGILAGATVRALPAPAPATAAPAIQPVGHRAGNAAAMRAIDSATGKQYEDACLPESSGGKQEPSSLGESATQSAIGTLLRGDGVDHTLASILRELAHDKFCEALRMLIERIRRAAKLVTNPRLVDMLVDAQAKIEGKGIPPVGSKAYHGLQKRAIRAYVLEGQLTEVEQQSTAVEVAAGARAAAEAGDRGAGLSNIIDEQIKANTQLDEAKSAP